MVRAATGPLDPPAVSWRKRATMKWERHYAGIDVHKGRFWYLQRDSKTKRLSYARVDLGWYGFGWRRPYKETIVWINSYRRAPLRVQWSHTFRR
jgi:hypothetical protein